MSQAPPIATSIVTVTNGSEHGVIDRFCLPDALPPKPYRFKSIKH